jgi:hypothetical protein
MGRGIRFGRLARVALIHKGHRPKLV